MKKKRNRPAQKSAQKKKAAAQVEAPDASRRDVLRLARNGSIGAVALAGAGWWVVSGVRATAYEHDLTRVGQGTPSIVQIHDPKCALCTELQRETRKALKAFDEDDILYLVASILTCLLYTSPSPRDRTRSRMPSSA